MPDFAFETEHGGRVAGVDEVGRGPLAGPVVAAAVVFPAGLPARVAEMLDDSKKLPPNSAHLAYNALFASGVAKSASAPHPWPRSRASTSCKRRCWP